MNEVREDFSALCTDNTIQITNAICNMHRQYYAKTVPDFLGAVLGEILAMCTDDTTGLVTSSP